MKKSDEPAAQTELDKLEFPDWSGMDDSSGRVSAQTAFKLVEQYPIWFPEAFRRCLANRPSPCPVEFIL